jgi:putative thioredoxin
LSGERLSIFPLNGVILFPGLQLPLHVFEPRYRALVGQAHSAIELAGSPVDASELDALRQAAAERPADSEAQFDFAQAAYAAGERDAAAETLLKLIETDPEWNEGAAKAKLLQIFEAVGLEDPWVQAQRRKLSLLLFG